MDLQDAASTPETESAGIVTTTQPESTPGAVVEPAGKVDSLDDILGATIKEKRGQAADKSGDGKPPATDDRPRDASGKFLPKDQVGDTAPKGEPGQQAPGKVTEPKPQTAEAPAHWTPEQKATFAKLDPAGQKFLLDRYKDTEAAFTRKSQELSDTSKLGDTVRSLFTDQDRQRMAISGTDEIGFIRQLKGLFDYARSDPASYVKWAMQSFGLTPEQLGFSTATGPDPSDPEQHQRQQAELTPQTVQQLVQQGISQFQTEQRRTELQNQVNAFKAQTDETGAPKYPHFDRVRGVMSRLYDSIPDGPDRLQKAYEAAVRADPELHQAEVERASARQAAEAQKAAEIAKARQAAAPVKHQGTVPAVADTRGQSLDDVLKNTIAEVRNKRM